MSSIFVAISKLGLMFSDSIQTGDMYIRAFVDFYSLYMSVRLQVLSSESNKEVFYFYVIFILLKIVYVNSHVIVLFD